MLALVAYRRTGTNALLSERGAALLEESSLPANFQFNALCVYRDRPLPGAIAGKVRG